MAVNAHVRKAATAGLIFLAVRPIVEDAMEGVDYSLIAINVAGAVAFALMSYGWLWWWEKRAIKRSARMQGS